jgi:uncharacterized protein (TIRG00374 family)
VSATRRRLARWGAVAVLVALAVVAARTVDWAATWQAIRRASPALLLAATLANFASLGVRGLRWWLFLRVAGSVRADLAVRGAFVASGLNNVIAANGGEAARVLFVARRGGLSTAPVLATLALDRLMDALSCVGLLALAPLVLPLPSALDRFRLPTTIALAVLAPLVLVLVWRARRATTVAEAAGAALATRALAASADAPLEAPASRWRRMQRTARAYAARFGAAMTGLLTGRRLVAALLLSLVSWLGQAATYHLVARSVGFPVTVAQSTAAMLVVNLSFLVQLTPGNVGVVQLLYALVMAAFGLPRTAAIGVAVLLQAVQIVPVTALAIGIAGMPRGSTPRQDLRAGPSS